MAVYGISSVSTVQAGSASTMMKRSKNSFFIVCFGLVQNYVVSEPNHSGQCGIILEGKTAKTIQKSE